MQFYKINEQCLQNLQKIVGVLSEIEVKGKNVSYLYMAGLTLESTLEQIGKDNQEEQKEEIPKENKEVLVNGNM